MNTNEQKQTTKVRKMALSERQSAIIKLLKEKNSLEVKALSIQLFVSEATVRRDLTELQKLGLLERSHGGAVLLENSDEVSIFVRMNKNSKEKERVASIALPRLPSFHSVFIDSSSSALALAERMDLSYKTVVTNNLQTAITLSKKKNINLILLGGYVQYNTVSSTGSFTSKQLEDFYFDLMISSCSAVIGDGVFESSLEQKEIKKAAFMRSKCHVLLFDGSKYEGIGTYKVASLEDYEYIFTDKRPVGNTEKLNLFTD